MDIDHHTGNAPRRWYDGESSTVPPFVLQAKSLSTEDENARSFVFAALFPWTKSSFPSLFNGAFSRDEEKVAQWQAVAEKWAGVVAVGGGSRLRFLLTRPNQPYLPLFTIEVPPTKKAPEPSVRCAAWCMVALADQIRPLIAFASNSVLYIFDVVQGKYHGILRGHGGQINHIAVHPWDPSLILTASHDYTCRIYDIREKVETKVVNPSWPGQKDMAYGGPAFGLRSNDGEGFGYGRCIAVLAGGPAGGHQAAVLCAAFHPNLPLIATSGMDHAVKIWQMPPVISDDPDKSLMIRREDKPLFSSTKVHMAQVLSISWINADTLLSHSGPIVMRKKLGERDEGSSLYPIELWHEPGTTVLWRWLGLDRYFPPGMTVIPNKLRGCASDYQESSSFKIISAYRMPIPNDLITVRAQRLPDETAHLHVFSSPSHAPLIIFPGSSDSHHAGNIIYVSSMKHFQPRKRPPFPNFEDEVKRFDGDASDADIEELAEATGRMTTDERPTLPELDTLPVWKMRLEDVSKGEANAGAIKACVIGENGRLLVGVGEKESVWIFRIS